MEPRITDGTTIKIAGEQSLAEALETIGFNDRLREIVNYQDGSRGERVPARIAEVHRDRFAAFAAGPGGEMAEMHLRAPASMVDDDSRPFDRPSVGDWVLARRVDGLDGRVGLAGMIVEILPRAGILARKEAGLRQEAQILAANVDIALIVAAAGRDFNPRRLERYLALAWEGGTNPVIVLTKMDLAENGEELVAEAEAVAVGNRVVATSIVDGRGLGELASLLAPGRTAVLLGSSGAGKSSLLNALAGSEVAATGAVRLEDERGRHTTTRRELFILPPGAPAAGALIIDTPGLREIQLWAEEDSIDQTFSDIEEIATLCKFHDCSHETEPGCAVREALADGRLEAQRLASWTKLRREIAWLARKDDASLRRAERERWKAINKSMRGYTKERRSMQGSAR